MKSTILSLALLVAAFPGSAAETANGFQDLFDGQTLQGWQAADLSFWSVQDGAITGKITPAHPLKENLYLIWQGGALADFELKLKHRVFGSSNINCGFQFRSRELPNHDVAGYQVDNNLDTDWLVRLYDEHGRHRLAWRGQRTTFDERGKATNAELAEAKGAPWFRLEEWHEYHLICVGPRLTLKVDGRLAAEVEDRDPQQRELTGILALQLHTGPPTTAQFKDIRLKVLKPVAAAPASPPPSAVRGEIVLARASHEWMSQQIEEPCILPNPKVPGRLIMFYSAVAASNQVVAAIGKAWADTRTPFRWQQDEANPIFRPSGTGWDSTTIRLDAVLYIPEADAYYIYYSGSSGTIQDRIGLAICPAGADGYSEVNSAAIARYGAAPVLAPEPAAPFHETMASQAAVLREWNRTAERWDWYLYYSYRGKDGTLPGIRLATSTDGKRWTRQFNADDPRGMGQIFRSMPDAYYEWHQAFKVGGTYVLCIEVGVDHGARWRPGLAVSTNPARGWTQLDLDTMLQTKWSGLYDDRTLYHVATPALYLIDGKWYLFAQACGQPPNQNYIDGAWEMWGVACDRVIATRPDCAALHIPGPADTASIGP